MIMEGLLIRYTNAMFIFSQLKSELGKKQDVMTLSDSDDVQTISSGSDDNKEREKVTTGIRKTMLKFKPD